VYLEFMRTDFRLCPVPGNLGKEGGIRTSGLISSPILSSL
jgi:hypothetical protein